MEDATRFMLNTVFSCVAGYPEEVIAVYADVFERILENDKILKGKKWDRGRAYGERAKYFPKSVK